MSLADLREYDPNHRPPCLENWYCPECSCNKSGYEDEPNPVTEACDNPSCLCHRDARCSCCEGSDGLGCLHFESTAQLRQFLATPGHEQVVDIDVAHIPGLPYGMVFVTAGEAEAWLDEYVEEMAAELAVEMGRRPTRGMLP